MEASMAQGTQGQQGQGEGEGNGGQQAPDVSALADQLGTMAQGQEELRQFLMSAPWQQQEQAGEQEQQLPELDLSMLDPDSPQFDANEVAQRLTGFVEQQAQSRADALLQQHIQPMGQELAMLRRSAEARDLVAEFPELGEADTARNVVGLSQQMAETLGQPALADSPQFWRLVYMAGRAAEAAQQEGSEEPPAAHLEGGGGAGPGGGQQADLKAQILGGKRGGSVLPFG